MKRGIWILLAIGALLLTGETGMDLEDLRPVETLLLSTEEEQVILETDTGDRGEGESLPAAVRNLNETSEGRIFLETAAFLIYRPEAAPVLPQLKSWLRPETAVCVAEENLDVKTAGRFLNFHRPDCTLRELWKKSEEPPVLSMEKGRYRLAGEEADP